MTAHDVETILDTARKAREIAYATDADADVASYMRIRQTAYLATGVDVALEPRP
jgi:hypothetical protein